MNFNYKIIFILLSALILLFIISPILGMFISTSAPELFDTIKDKEVIKSIKLTMITSLIATIFMAFGAIPLAYILARKNFFLKKFVSGLIDLPIVIPHSAAGIAVLGFISRNTILGKIASFFGINFVGNPIGIAFAMAFVSIPFLINSARNGFEAVPVRLEKAALSLGASPVKVFFSISIPLAYKSIFSGLLLMFARGLSEFGAVVIIAYHPMVTPVLIFERFSSYGLQYARPVAVLFILISLSIFILMRWLSGEKKNA